MGAGAEGESSMNLQDIETETGESVQDVLDRDPDPEETRRQAQALWVEVRAERRMKGRA